MPGSPDPKASGSPRARERGGLRYSLIVGAAGISVTPQENRQGHFDQQQVFHGVACFLATITARRCNRVLRALDAPFRAIVPKREKAGTGVNAVAGRVDAVDDIGVGTPPAPAAASATLRRWANTFTDRVGASPCAQRRPQGTQQDMNPPMGFALAHAEQAPLHHLEGVGLQVDEDPQQLIL
jgi:hypothetical protein